jgi:hypothetical protein
MLYMYTYMKVSNQRRTQLYHYLGLCVYQLSDRGAVQCTVSSEYATPSEDEST